MLNFHGETSSILESWIKITYNNLKKWLTKVVNETEFYRIDYGVLCFCLFFKLINCK